MNTGIEKNSFILYQKPTKGAENSKMLFLDLAKHLFATERHQIIASTFARADESNRNQFLCCVCNMRFYSYSERLL